MKDSPHLAGLDRYRQGRVLERLLSTATSNAHILGAIVIGSFATGEVDPMSDIDIMLVVADGRFEEVWRMRGDIRGTNTLAAWDASRVGLDKAGVHKWVTQELVLVECIITEPSAREAPAVQRPTPISIAREEDRNVAPLLVPWARLRRTRASEATSTGETAPVAGDCGRLPLKRFPAKIRDTQPSPPPADVQANAPDRQPPSGIDWRRPAWSAPPNRVA